MEYIVCYQTKSGFANIFDTITLQKPGNDFYEILHITLPKGYEYDYNIFEEPCIYSPSGGICELSREGKYGKSGNVIATSTNPKTGKFEIQTMPFYNP